MNKKAYIKPLMEEMILETESQMMTASEPGIATGFATRGTWGDLWGGEE